MKDVFKVGIGGGEEVGYCRFSGAVWKKKDESSDINCLGYVSFIQGLNKKA
jgi:hypothetical protein